MDTTEPRNYPRDIHTVPQHERHFYGKTAAFGRFGSRQFTPEIMVEPHWHGHIEFNFCVGATLVYLIDGETVRVPADRLAVFWAGVPHRLVGIDPEPGVVPRLTNIYLPADIFLAMPHIAWLQIALLAGGMALLPAETASFNLVNRWYRDYRAGDFERSEVVRMEINVLLRRALLDDLEWLRIPPVSQDLGRTLSSSHIRHVIEMVRHIIENLGEPMTNAQITAVTGLHENYALTLFTQSMRIPLKKFVIRLRLLRARGMLTESSMAISTVAEHCGFTSLSQFYHHFRAAYGVSPNVVRKQYVEMTLR